MAKRTRKTRDPIAQDPEKGFEGADAQARLAWECWRQTRTHLRDWRSEASENYDFVAGQQWAEEDLAALQEQQRTPIVFNRIQATMAAVSGYEINGRQEVTYLPRNPDDTGVAEVDTQAAKYFRQACDAEDEESDQFRDMLITGLGWIEHRMDYDDQPEGMLKVERVDPLEMGYDPSALRPNLVDRRWDIRGKWWDKKLAKEKWPDADFDTPTPSSYENSDLDGQPPIDRIAASFYKSPGVGETAQLRQDKVFILERTWFEHEAFYTVLNPTTGKTEDVDPSTHKRFQDRLAEVGMPPAKSVKRYRKRFKRAFVHGPNTIEEGDAPCPNGFHYQPITAHRNRNKNTWFGLVSLMKDPQRWANKWLSQFLHLLNTNAKTGMFYEDGAFERPGEVEKKIAKPGFAIGVNPGYLDKIKLNEPSPIPPDAMNLMTYAISSIKDAPGVNLELMGQQQNDQPGVVEHARQKSALNVLAPLFAAQRQYRKIAGRLTLYFIREYLSDGRWIRITGQANAKYVQLAEQQGSAEYDIIVDQSPTSPNQKEAVFGALGSIMPALMKAGVPIPPTIVDYVPSLPAQLAEEWKELIQQKASAPPPPDPKHQIEMAKIQAQQEQSANQDKIDSARLQFDQQKMSADMQLAQLEAQNKQREMELREEELRSKERIELAKISLEAIKAHQDREFEREQAVESREHEKDRERIKREAPAIDATVGNLTKAIAKMGEHHKESMKMIADAMNSDRELVRDKQGRAVGMKRVAPKGGNK